ncbi:MAG: tryptophan 7-halogenase [Lysobacterales bacterium]
MTDVHSSYDVAIVGGGLAGLTLALQLHQNSPQLEIVVLERSLLPPPVAAHKVGESVVEIGAHYLSHTLGLKPLLESTQLRKFGLRFFFDSGSHADLAHADELGASNYLSVASYQLDRGQLETDLARILKDRGVCILDGCMVKQVAIGSNGMVHQLQFSQEDQSHTIRCQWVIDAASRFGLLKRHFDLAQPIQHNINAAWFRLDTPIAVDEWSDSQPWKERCNGVQRRLSTNHLVGSGYWTWIIPLVGDRTSIGLVSDPDIHPFSSMNSFGKLVDWLASNQPQLAEKVSGARETLMDFKYLKHPAHDCKQLWSHDRWALTGEAGVFADPYYSPGTDFIAISNTFICDLITRSRSESQRQLHSVVYEKMYKSFFSSTMTLYEQQYPGFGDSRLTVVKSTWDYCYYWSVLAWLYFRDVMTDISFIRTIEPRLAEIRALNDSLQSVFRLRAAEKHSASGQGRFFDQVAIPVMRNLNAALLEPTDNLQLEFTKNCERLDDLAPLLLNLLNATGASGSRHCSLLGDLSRRFG